MIETARFKTIVTKMGSPTSWMSIIVMFLYPQYLHQMEMA